MNQPSVTVIVPTTHQRRVYNEAILNTFIRQDYKHKEILWDYEEGTIGAKRNRLCEKARGEIICTMDSDDAYSNDWISKSVEALLMSNADITGLSTLNFYNDKKKEAWQYRFDLSHGMWLAGATLCYKKSFWQANPFPDLQVSEDTVFVGKAKSIYNHGYIEGFLASIHEGNTSERQTYNRNWRRLGEEEEQKLREHWKL